MTIELYMRHSIGNQEAQNLVDFLRIHLKIGEEEPFWFSGPAAELFPKLQIQTLDQEPDEVDLFVSFTSPETPIVQSLLADSQVAKFLVGWRGLPDAVDHVCIPFERTRFNTKWLRRTLETARRHGWQPRLWKCENGLMAREISKLSRWFHMNEVMSEFQSWVQDEVRQDLSQIFRDFPETEIQTHVGSFSQLLASEDPKRTILLGQLQSGPHLPGRIHGLPYAEILARCGLCGYFPSKNSAT